MNIMKFALTMISLAPSIAFAFFCPSNFNSINVGDSIDQVLAQCGKPDSQATKDAPDSTPQNWTYYLPQQSTFMNVSPQNKGKLNVSIALDANGKVVNISVNGTGVGSTPLCGKSISIGDTGDSVKSACGDPSTVDKQQSQANPSTQSNKVTTFIYNSIPPVNMTFMNGKLTDRQ